MSEDNAGAKAVKALSGLPDDVKQAVTNIASRADAYTNNAYGSREGIDKKEPLTTTGEEIALDLAAMVKARQLHSQKLSEASAEADGAKMAPAALAKGIEILNTRNIKGEALSVLEGEVAKIVNLPPETVGTMLATLRTEKENSYHGTPQEQTDALRKHDEAFGVLVKAVGDSLQNGIDAVIASNVRAKPKDQIAQSAERQ